MNKTLNAEKIAARKNKIVYVDNANAASAKFPELGAIVTDCVLNGNVLPEDFSDMFSLEIVEVDGEPRGILRFT